MLHWMPACVVWTLRWYPDRSVKVRMGVLARCYIKLDASFCMRDADHSYAVAHRSCAPGSEQAMAGCAKFHMPSSQLVAAFGQLTHMCDQWKGTSSQDGFLCCDSWTTKGRARRPRRSGNAATWWTWCCCPSFPTSSGLLPTTSRCHLPLCFLVASEPALRFGRLPTLRSCYDGSRSHNVVNANRPCGSHPFCLV